MSSNGWLGTLGAVGVGIVGVLGFGAFRNRKQKAVPDRIDLQDFLNNNPKAREQFFNDLREYRFAVLKCDEETKRTIAEFKRAGLDFFSLDKPTKEAFVGRNANQENSDIESFRTRKVNKGYVYIEGVKEFLKLQSDETPPPSLQTQFQSVQQTLHKIGAACLESAANATIGNSTFMKKEFYAEVCKRLSRSSVSLIRYFAVPSGSPDDSTNNSNEYEVYTPTDKDKDKVTTDGLTYPSKTHTDTGILTLIICSDVPGLQVWDTKNNEWLEVEKIVNPMEDMFVVLGRKMQLFAQDQPSALTACTHRVALPLNTGRSSLLYFVDVPQ